MRCATTILALCVLVACNDASTLTAPDAAAFAAAPAVLHIDRVVYPTGAFPADPDNVQAAIDLGGTVLLKATNVRGEPTEFNFGPPTFFPGRVGLRVDVRILGETAGSHRTTVRGSWVPFIVFRLIRFEISGINFEEPVGAAIVVVRATGAEIIGNRIANVVALPGTAGFPFSEASGIKFLGNSDPDFAITGRVRVADNVIEDLPADFGWGIVFDFAAADLEVTGNRIRNVSTAIEVDRNKGSIRITDNDIAPGMVASGNGVIVFGSRGGVFYVADNTIVCENPLADGILVGGTPRSGEIVGAVIERNQVQLHGSQFGAIGLFGRVSQTYVGQNWIEGSGALGLNIVQFVPGDLARFNTFVGNNLSGYESSIADVFLDVNSVNTALAGFSGTVVDLGTDNQITGATTKSIDANIGQQIRDAQARRHAARQ